jgi:hypothetical protein
VDSRKINKIKPESILSMLSMKKDALLIGERTFIATRKRGWTLDSVDSLCARGSAAGRRHTGARKRQA